jgi:hypothetical protein
MMINIIHYSPNTTITAAENLKEFIRMCKDDLAVFGIDLKWQDWKWAGQVHFTKIGVSTNGSKDNDRLDNSLMDFAKAYFRYQQGHKPTGTKNESKALRVIETALLHMNGNADIDGLNVAVLDEAAQIGRNHYSPQAAYQCGRELERLANFVSKKRLITTDVSTWKHPIKKPNDITIQTGAKAKAIQDKKQPDEIALNALAELFANNPSDPKDIFTTSTFAMLMVAPSRITEILELPADLEVEELDSKNMLRYGWRFFSGKGFEGDIKWIPTVMVNVAREAVKRLLVLTEEPRNLARWIEANPGKPYRHSNCPDVADNDPLTVFEACQYLGLANTTRRQCTTSLGAFKLPTTDKGNSLNSLWQYVMSRQPEDFPWLSKEKRIKYSNALFCMNANFLHETRGISPVLLWAPNVNVFNNDLSPRESLKSDSHKSIFDRWSYKDAGGGKLKVTSHQVRHLLNTIANRGGLSQEKIAKWSGRADSKQNRVYNHMTEFEMVAKAESLDTSLSLFGPKGEVAPQVPLTSEEFNLLERGAMHWTLYGVCVHDWTMSPCEKFRDCNNCQEQVCIKGDTVRLSRIKVELEQKEKDLLEAEKRISDGYMGADRWYEHHKKSVKRLREQVSILENPDVPDGAQIKLRDGSDYSHLRRAISIKTSNAIQNNKQDAHILSEMTRMLRE